MLLIAAIGAGIALSGGLFKTGEGVSNLASSTGHSLNDITGIIPWLESKADTIGSTLGEYL